MKRICILILGLGFLLNVDACGPKDPVEPASEKTCKLQYDPNSFETYSYDDNYRVILSTNSNSTNRFIYDQDGYLLQQVRSNGYTITYQYTNGLLSAKEESIGSDKNTYKYEYNSQNKLIKRYYQPAGGSLWTYTYDNGKIISVIENGNRTIYEYNNGKLIREIWGSSYLTYDYDSKGRLVRNNKYNSSGQLTEYSEYVYQENGIPYSNVSPENFFKGFPDEVKFIRPNGLLIKSTTYSKINNNLVRSAETTSAYVLNAKGYPTSVTNTQSYRNSAGLWITNNPYKTTYAYINCDE